MTNFSLQFHGFSIYYFVAFLIALGLYLYLSLKKKNGTPLAIERWLLILRTTTLTLLFFVALQPEVHWQKHLKIPPKVILTLDNSLSIAAQKGFQRDSLLHNLKVLEEHLAKRKIRVAKLAFDAEINENIDDFSRLRFDGVATNLSAVLKRFQESTDADNYLGAILITDGIATCGEDPLSLNFNPRFPVFTVGVGDSTPLFDPRVANLEVPLVATASDTVKVKTEIIPLGNGELLDVVLQLDDKLSQRHSITTQNRDFRRADEFCLVIKEPGIHKIKVAIQPRNDINPYNNWSESTIRINADKINIVLIDGSGSFEGKFLKAALGRMPVVNVINLIQTQNNYIPTPLSAILPRKWQGLVLIGYPTNNTDVGDLTKLKRKIATEKVPLWFIINEQTDLNKLTMSRPAPPWRGRGLSTTSEVSSKPIFQEIVKNKSSESVNVNFNESNRSHALLQNIGLYFGSTRDLASLPPLGMPFKKVKLDPAWQVLLVSAPPNDFPIIACREDGLLRQCFYLGNDFWRWQFMSGEESGFYDELVRSTLSWLGDTLSQSNILLSMNREVFLKGEVLEIGAQVFDLKGKSLTHATVVAKIIDARGEVAQIPLQWDGFRYFGEYLCSAPGEFKLQLKATIGSLTFMHPERIFQVTDQPIELMQLRQNAGVLRSLAQRSGGEIINPVGMMNLADRFTYKEKIITIQQTLKLWRSGGMLILLMILLVGEWVLRRRFGFQ